MWQHFVYMHRKADSGEPFYVGKGRLKKNKYHERAYAKESRSMFWNRVFSKHGITIEIIASCKTDMAAQALERSLIKEIGRRNLGSGPLVNLTDGGDGHAGLIAPDHLRKKRSKNAKRPRSRAWIASIRVARKGGGNGGVVKHGDKLPASWRRSLAAAKVGAKNPMFGRTGNKHPMSKRVINIATGEEYPTVTMAAAAIGVRMQTLHNMLTGFRKNHTSMRLP